jgi:hypothetical protein
MKIFLEPIVAAATFAAAAVALLFVARRHIHRQMEEIAEAARAGAFKRPFAFGRKTRVRATS